MGSKNNFIDEEKVPLIEQFRGKTFVIKYGGSIMNNEIAQEAFIEDLILMKNAGINIIVVHGGGPEINKWLAKAGVENKFVNGLRVTDYCTMEIVEMVLSGKVNKKLSLSLSRKGLKAIGLSGKDNNLIHAKKKYVYKDKNKLDIGLVGEVINVNTEMLVGLLNNDYIPIIAPIGCDKEGNTYNINADYAASYISGILKAEKLLIMTDVEGVYKDINDEESLILSLTIDEIKYLIKKGIITKGMIPKLECCIDAIEKGTKNVHLIDGRKKHSLINNIITHCGTEIVTQEGDLQCQKVI